MWKEHKVRSGQIYWYRLTKQRFWIQCLNGIAKKSSNSCFVWLFETWTLMWPTINEIKISELSWYPIEEAVQRLREIVMLQYFHHKTCTVIPGGSISCTFHNKCNKYNFEGSPRILEEFHDHSSMKIINYSGGFMRSLNTWDDGILRWQASIGNTLLQRQSGYVWEIIL